jgi:N-acylglucosamine-6-phosphate 2-epimerase
MRRVGTIVALARCAELGGAGAVRVDGATNIGAVREAISLPIIGINKVRVGPVTLITPSLEVLATLRAAGASIAAIELTRRAHASKALYREVLAEVKCHRANDDIALMADISTLDEGLAAWDAGVDLIGTTLSGYTDYARATLPDLTLVEALAKAGCRVVAEGGYNTPESAAQAIERGAWAVCVGTAITDPLALTKEYVRALARAAPTGPSTAEGDGRAGRGHGVRSDNRQQEGGPTE